MRGRYDDADDNDDVIDDDDDASCDSLDDEKYVSHRKKHVNQHQHILSNHQPIIASVIQPLTEENTSPSFLLTRANKRASRLISKLHRLALEKEELRNRYEDICKKERQFVLSTKVAQDATRRFNITQQENTRLKSEMEHDQKLLQQVTKDLESIRIDASHWKEQELSVRNERDR